MTTTAKRDRDVALMDEGVDGDEVVVEDVVEDPHQAKARRRAFAEDALRNIQQGKSLVDPTNASADLGDVISVLRGKHREATAARREVEALVEAQKIALHSVLGTAHGLRWQLSAQRQQIADCKNDTKVAQDVGLCSLEEFMSTPAGQALGPDASEHDVMKARLQHELDQRQHMVTHLQQLCQQRDAQQAELDTKVAFQASLHDRLADVVADAAPLRNVLGVKASQGGALMGADDKCARLCPPLLRMYRHARAFLSTSPSHAKSCHVAIVKSPKPDARAVAPFAAPEQWAVELEVVPGTNDSVTLLFQYHAQANLVSCTVPGGHVHLMFANLFPQDVGDTSTYDASLPSVLTSAIRCFAWCQYWAGLRTDCARVTAYAAQRSLERHVNACISSIQQRLVSQDMVAAQVALLARGRVPTGHLGSQIAPLKVGTTPNGVRLLSWQAVTLTDKGSDGLDAMTSVNHGCSTWSGRMPVQWAVDANGCRFYQSTVTGALSHPDAVVRVDVVLNPAYPRERPLFALHRVMGGRKGRRRSSKGRSRTSASSSQNESPFPPHVVSKADASALSWAQSVTLTSVESAQDVAALKQIENRLNTEDIPERLDQHFTLAFCAYRLMVMLERYCSVCKVCVGGDQGGLRRGRDARIPSLCD